MVRIENHIIVDPKEAFETYEIRAPANQNAIDAIAGWNSEFPSELGVTAGNRVNFADPRVAWALEHYGSVMGKNVLELGPLEGAHTYLLDRSGANITAVEANRSAFLRCLVTKELLGLPRARFLLGDGVQFLEQNETRYDLIFACGVLYHMVDPLRFLEAVASRTDAIYLWTHVIDDDRGTAPNYDQTSRYDNVRETRLFRHKEITLYRRSYMNGQMNPDFCGGMYDSIRWMERGSLLEALASLGFSYLRMGHMAEANPLEPSLSILAKR
jgi:hypothetical protein